MYTQSSAAHQGQLGCNWSATWSAPIGVLTIWHSTQVMLPCCEIFCALKL